MRTATIQPLFEDWRDRARELLALRVPPGEVLWSDVPGEPGLFAPAVDGPPDAPVPTVPAAFLDLARSVAAHTDPRRWGALYGVLWRLTHGGERHLLAVATDPAVRQLQLWAKVVGRDIHKMHAFVRFRLVGTCAATGREQFVAWFEPEYRIVRLAAGFFKKRFAGMDWSILTPYECAHWDGGTLQFSAGVPRSQAPDGDALDELWRTYFRSIFNPARLKVKAMQSEMPKKYWKNLPEAPLIPELISGSAGRVEEMLRTELRPVKPAPRNAYLRSLHEMNAPDPPPSPDGPDVS
jgi:probable DNA metabolism protein